eukprot:jgi/Mesvir1/23290/Mv25951-RA.1
MVDSSAVLGCMVKGRSSSYRLNQVARRVAALSLAADTRSHWVYVRTSSNPADGPSRARSAPVAGGWRRDLTSDGDVEANPGPRLRNARHRLLEGTVNPRSTLPRYHRAVSVFLAWLPPGEHDPTEAEALFCEWVSAVYESGGGRGRTLCQQAKQGLRLYQPSVVDSWQMADRMLRGWGRLVPCQSPPPVPWRLCYLAAVLLLSRHQTDMAALVLVAFQQYLRISEALGLRVGDVAFPGDPRLGPARGQGALLLRDPKTAQGGTQHVLVEDPLSLGLLSALCRGRAPGALVFGGLTYAQARSQWVSVWTQLQLPGKFTLHSLRHGGATHDALRNIPTADIQRRGRWRAADSVQRYVGLHRALLLDLPPRLWALAHSWDPAHWRAHFRGHLL